MKKFVSLLLITILVAVYGQAQIHAIKIKGQLTDQITQKPLPAATVALQYAKDSSIASTVLTDNKGNFEFTNIIAGAYRLYISFLGYKLINSPLQVNTDNNIKLMNLGNLVMKPQGMYLNEVEIIEEKPPITVKKDTVEFNADAFKTRENAVVEDLLKKLPGVTVDNNGAITSQGETVTKILVDGKPFFGNDPKLATKNLPANIINKVQVIDKKSDQAQFTQIDDGQTEKVINITIKKDKKKGLFGRAAAGYGTDDRFGTTLSLNRFRDNQQLSLLGGGNNVNNLGFSQQDQGGFGKGGGRSPQNLAGGNNAGITRNWNTGLNFNQNIDKNFVVNGSYFFNDMQTDKIQKSDRQTFLPDSTSYYNNNSQSQTNNSNHLFNARIEYRIDSMHALIFTPNYSVTNTNNYSATAYQSLNSKLDTINKGMTINDGEGGNQVFGGQLLFTKKFKTPGRTLSANFTYNNTISQQENFNKSRIFYFNPDSIVTFNQRNDINTDSRNAGVNLTYTQPVAQDRYLVANYSITKYTSNSNKYTYDYDINKATYNIINDSLSNAFTNNTLNQQTGLALRTHKLKYDYSFGVNVLFNNLDNLTHSFLTGKENLIHQSTVNFAPSAIFNYTFSKHKRLGINYNGTTQQPTVQQLQPVPDNSNPLYIQLGNPDLKPAFNNTLRVDFRQFDNTTFRGMFASFNGSFGTNKIVNATTLDSKGKQTSKPVNVNGYFSLRGMLNNTIPLSKTPGKRLNAGTSISYNRDVNFTNGHLNYSNSLQLSQSLNINYTYKELLDAFIGGSVNYNATSYTLSQSQNTRYLDYNLNMDVNVNLPYNFLVGSDINCTFNRGRTAGYNLTSTMWNANIAKYVFPKKQGMIKLQGFDLLRQYISVSRTVNDNYIQDVQSNVLQQYFMISFTYFLNKFGGNNKGDKGPRMGFPPGGPGGKGGFRPERF